MHTHNNNTLRDDIHRFTLHCNLSKDSISGAVSVKEDIGIGDSSRDTFSILTHLSVGWTLAIPWV